MNVRITNGFDYRAVEGRAAQLLHVLLARRVHPIYTGCSSAWQAGAPWIVVQNGTSQSSLHFEPNASPGNRFIRMSLLLQAARALASTGYTLLPEFSCGVPSHMHEMAIFSVRPLRFLGILHYAEAGEFSAPLEQDYDCHELLRLTGRGVHYALSSGPSIHLHQARAPQGFAIDDLRFILRIQQRAPDAADELFCRVRRGLTADETIELVIEEHSMEESLGTDAKLMLCLGSLEMSWSDLYRLRPGSIIELAGVSEMRGALQLEGQEWASVVVTCDGERLVCRVAGFPALQELLANGLAEETSGPAPRLVDELLRSAAAPEVPDPLGDPVSEAARQDGSRGVSQ